MFIYKPNYSTDILYALYGVIILLLIAFFISQPTANNDIYMPEIIRNFYTVGYVLLYRPRLVIMLLISFIILWRKHFFILLISSGSILLYASLSIVLLTPHRENSPDIGFG